MTNPREPDDDSNTQAQLLAAVRHHDHHHNPVLWIDARANGVGVFPFYGGECDLMGWDFYGVGSVSNIQIIDGKDASGGIMALVAAPVGLSTTQWLGPDGIRCRAGVTLNILTGSPFTYLYVRPVGHHRSR